MSFLKRYLTSSTIEQAFSAGRSKRLALISFLVIGGFYVLSRAYLGYEAFRTRQMLDSLASIQIGTSEQDAVRVLAPFGGYRYDTPDDIESGEHGYRIVLLPFGFETKKHEQQRITTWIYDALYRARRLRRSAGLRVFSTLASVHCKQGRVSRVATRVLAEGTQEWLAASWELEAEFPKYVLVREEQSPDPTKLYAHWAHLHADAMETGEALATIVTSHATATELRAARHIRTRCLISQFGCSTMCDFFPQPAIRTWRSGCHHYLSERYYAP